MEAKRRALPMWNGEAETIPEENAVIQPGAWTKFFVGRGSCRRSCGKTFDHQALDGCRGE